MAHLVIGGMQPGRAVDTQSRTVEVAISARTQRARQRGVGTAAERAPGTGSLAISGRSLDTARVDERMAAWTEVDAARQRTRRTVNNR